MSARLRTPESCQREIHRLEGVVLEHLRAVNRAMARIHELRDHAQEATRK